MKLLAYIINGQTVGTELTEWDTSALDGNQPFKYSETEEEGYSDITSMINIELFGFDCAVDYIYGKDRIREISDSKGGWQNLTDDEKYLIIKYYIYRGDSHDALKMQFLMSKGMSYDEAFNYLCVAWSKHNKFGFIPSIIQRWNFTQFALVKHCVKSVVELELMNIDVCHSIWLMQNLGVVGSGYGDTNSKGIMDYFEGTGFYSYYNFMVSPITCLPGKTKEQALHAVQDIMINGNYDPNICNKC